MKKYILFGASKMAESILENHLIKQNEIDYFFDNNPKKWGTFYLQKEIKKPIYIEQAEILVTSMYNIEIVSQMLQMGYRKFHVALEYEGVFFIKDYDYSSYKDFNIIPNKVVLISENFSGCNAYALQHMHQNYLQDINLLLLNINIRKDETYFYDILTSKVIIYTHIGKEVNLPDKINIQLWHGFPLKGLNYTSNYSLMDYNLIEEQHKRWLIMNKVISLGHFYNLLMGASYGIPQNLFEITGYPRNDLLLLSNGKKNLEEIFPESKGKKIILYMPTFKKTVYGEKEGDKKGYLFNFDDFNFKDFSLYCKENKILFLLKIHAYDYQCIPEELKENDTIKILKDENFAEKDLYEYLNSADILITDYSSVYFDYLLLDRPIIFLNADADIYASERGFLLEPLEQWTPGVAVCHTKELQLEISSILSGKDDFKEKRKWVCDQVHQYQDAFSSKRILEMMQNMINSLNYTK